MMLGRLAARIVGLAGALAARVMRPDVVFIGDSITSEWAARDPWMFRPGRLNAGISGQITLQMRARFAADVIAKRPRAVHIMGGTNDLWFGDAGEGAVATLDHIAAMAEMARAAGIAVILAPPPPVAIRARGHFARLDLWDVVRAGVAELARTEGYGFVDYAEVLARDGDLVAAFTTDGIHLSRAGYLAMRAKAKRALKPSPACGRGS